MNTSGDEIKYLTILKKITGIDKIEVLQSWKLVNNTSNWTLRKLSCKTEHYKSLD